MSLPDRDHMKLVAEAKEILIEMDRGAFKLGDGHDSLALFYAACILAGAMGHDERSLIRTLMRITDDSRATLPNFK